MRISGRRAIRASCDDMMGVWCWSVRMWWNGFIRMAGSTGPGGCVTKSSSSSLICCVATLCHSARSFPSAASRTPTPSCHISC